MPIRYPTSRPRKHEAEFREVVGLIEVAKVRAYQSVNSTLVDLYWNIGAYIQRKLDAAEWGDGVVAQLAAFIESTRPDLKGFTRRSLFRMRQFYGIYRDNEKVAPLVRQLPWSHNLIIVSKCKQPEEREFYLAMAVRERWSKRELDHQIDACLFERKLLRPAKVSPVVTQLYPLAAQVFKDLTAEPFRPPWLPNTKPGCPIAACSRPSSTNCSNSPRRRASTASGRNPVKGRAAIMTRRELNVVAAL